MANKHTISTGEFSFRKGRPDTTLDNGVIAKPGRKVRLGSFAGLVANGDNPNGLMVQTPNGTSRQDHRQFDRAYQVNTDRWTKNEDWGGDMSGS